MIFFFWGFGFGFALVVSGNFIKSTHQVPKVPRNCFSKTFLFPFLVQLFKMFCYLYMALHFTIKRMPYIFEVPLKKI